MITITAGLQAAIVTELEKISELNGNIYDADADDSNIAYPFLVFDTWAKTKGNDKIGGGLIFGLTISSATGEKATHGHQGALELTELASSVIQQMENIEFGFQTYQRLSSGSYAAQSLTGCIHQVSLAGGQSNRQSGESLVEWVASESLTINVSII